MKLQRINIQLEPEDVRQLDEIADKLGIKRVVVVRGLVKLFLFLSSRPSVTDDAETLIYDFIENSQCENSAG